MPVTDSPLGGTMSAVFIVGVKKNLFMLNNVGEG